MRFWRIVPAAVLLLLGIMAGHQWNLADLVSSASEGERYGVAALLGLIGRSLYMLFRMWGMKP